MITKNALNDEPEDHQSPLKPDFYHIYDLNLVEAFHRALGVHHYIDHISTTDLVCLPDYYEFEKYKKEFY